MDLVLTLWNAAPDQLHYAVIALLDHVPGALAGISRVLERAGHTLYEDGSISR